MVAAGDRDRAEARVHRFVWQSAGLQRAFIAFSAGGASVLAFAPVFASPVLFLTLPIFVWLIDSSSDWKGASKDGFAFAFGYFLFNLFWIGEAFLVEAEKYALLLPFAVILLPAGLALFWAVASGLARCFWSKDGSRLFTLAIFLSLAEWLRGHILTGLPWNVPGYALTAPLELMQAAALGGVYLLTLGAILIFSAPLVLYFDGIGKPRSKRAWSAVLMAVLPLLLLWGYGRLRLDNHPTEFVPGIELRIVQPSIPQREKWLAEFQGRNFNEHLALSRQGPTGAVDDLNGITHVIWPEAAMPFLPLEHPEALRAIGEMLRPQRILITGALHREANAETAASGQPSRRQIFNSLMAFDDQGMVTALYDKIHLVPFGEYLPLAPVMSAFGLSQLANKYGAFTAGIEPRPLLHVAGLPALVGLVCYEALFPGQVVQSERPGLLVNVTNDGWFGDTTGPRQHFHQVRVRAVEEGLPLVRAANNGISAIIDANGRILQYLALDVRGVADGQLPQPLPPTIYAQFGDVPFAVFCGLIIAALSWRHRGQYL